MAMLKQTINFETTFNNYLAREIIGEGGAGRVYGASDDEGLEVAIKELKPDVNRVHFKRFKNEIGFLERTKHANIVRLLDHGFRHNGERKTIFYVMPRYPSNIAKAFASAMSPDRVLQVFLAILDGVEAAHLQNVIHRDLKPENILCSEDLREVMVADFGIARFLSEQLTAVETSPQQRLANFTYCAPEQKQRGRDVGVPADIYALGLILNELFTREVPHGTSYKKIGDVQPSHAFLDELVDSMIRQDPSARPASIDIIKQAIQKYRYEYVSRQRLDAIKRTVISQTEIDDPLVLDPPRISNVRWEAGILYITLDKPVHDKWVQALLNMGSYECVYGKEPVGFNFRENQVSISADENEAQRVINYFKSWLPKASSVLHSRLARESSTRAAEERQKLEQAAREEEKGQRINRSLTF
jgi:serine/threonine protein kinase